MKNVCRYLIIFILLPLVACADNSSESKAEATLHTTPVQSVQSAEVRPPIKEANTETSGSTNKTTEATKKPLHFTEGKYQEGVHYERLPQPVPTDDKNKIEVVEVFWYGCIHCYNFEPALKEWVSQLSDYVDYRSMPAAWNNEMLLHAQAFYTAKALGVFDKMHPILFDTMNKEGNRLENEAKIAKLFIANGVKKADFEKTFNSFGVKSLTGVAKSKLRSYRITGTPEIIVNGKFRLSGRMTGDNINMLNVVDWLIEKERRELLDE